MKLTLPHLIPLLLVLILPPACSKPNPPQQHLQHSDELVGEALFKERCRDCHKVGNEGRAIGPDLTRSGNKLRTPSFAAQVIREPAKVFPGTAMPQYRDLSDRQVTSLVQYLGSLN